MDFLEGPSFGLARGFWLAGAASHLILVLTLSHSAMSYREAILDRGRRAQFWLH
ncbi:MAG: hypothetical protein IPN71_12510 [Fibrobacteres bacterium]|nr:hypothetical protein [Fibrobacterota bacterium]